MKKAFKRGLIKAAASTGAWIITGGTNTGVMRLVGEAVADEYHAQSTNLVVLGIATWGKVALRNLMSVKSDKKEIARKVFTAGMVAASGTLAAAGMAVHSLELHDTPVQVV